MGIGAAIAGLYPIVTIGTGSFAFEAWPQIVNEAPNITYMSGGQVKVPIMFHALVGIRISGAAQHSARPQAMLMQAAGLQVIAPARASDVKGLLAAAKDSERPTFWIDHPLLFEEKQPADGGKPLPLGKAAVVRKGKDVTLVGYSIDLVRCLEAAKQLATAGHRCRSHRPADAHAARRRHDLRVGRQDRTAGGRGRMLSRRERGVGGGEHLHRQGLRAAQEAGEAAQFSPPCRCR